MTKSILTAILVSLIHLSVAAADTCWRDSYGRGVGVIPSECDMYEEKQGLLCYPKCHAGYDGVLNVCWQSCPGGSRDDGAFCRYAEYGRGAGFPWKFGDGLNDSGMFARCEKKHGKGKCEKNGAIVYPKCKPGYTNFGCCICRPKKVDCSDMAGQFDLSCAKKSYTRKTLTAGCPAGQENDAGLCYAKCKPGYDGVGPVCWGSCPASHPVNCGASCAATAADCAGAVTDQVVSVVDVAANIALAVVTAGGGNAIKTSVSTGAKAVKVGAKKAAQIGAKQGLKTAAKGLKKGAKKLSKSEIKRALKTMRQAALKKGGNAAREARKMDEKKIEQMAELLGKSADTADAASDGQVDPLEIAEIMDPTGIIAVVNAYNQPICSARSQASTCRDAVSGKIAWDYKGSKGWSPGNVAKLCRGAESSTEPARCFARVMHGGVNWGGGTQWQWSNALDLCKGTQNAEATIGCFTQQIRSGNGWKVAIGRCR